MLVQGTGAVGLSAIALARLGGAVNGHRDRRAGRAAASSRAGWGRIACSISTPPPPDERLERVRGLTDGEGVDVVVEAAGSARAFEEGLFLARDGGRYIVAGHYTDAGPSSVNVHQQINRKHLDIRGCWGSEPGHFLRALALLERRTPGAVARDWRADISAAIDSNDALAEAEAMRITKALVDPWASS